MPTYQWNPANLVVAFNHEVLGPHIVKGYAADTFVTVDAADDTWNDRSSADGYVVTRSRINNPLGELTLVLDAASPSNDYLQDVLERDKSNAGGIVSVSVTDNFGRERANAAQAWVRRQPANAYGAASGTRTWALRGADMEIHTRGSSQIVASTGPTGFE